MTSIFSSPFNADAHKYGVIFVFAAGILWSTVGLGIRMIEDAVVWQILLYRSISMSLFLYVLIRIRSVENPFSQIRRIGYPVVIAGLSLVAAYSGGIYSIQNTSVANAMLLFATAPFMAAVLGWIALRERVRFATWIAIIIAIGGINETNYKSLLEKGANFIACSGYIWKNKKYDPLQALLKLK